jgi:hypothetical protein
MPNTALELLLTWLLLLVIGAVTTATALLARREPG